MKLYNKIFEMLLSVSLLNVHYAKASMEQPMETISLKAHQLDWKTMSFSMPKANLVGIEEIREITSKSIISGIANKNPEKFSVFEAIFGDTKSLLENPQTIAAILKNEPKAYYIKEKNENGQYDFNIDEANAVRYDKIFNGYIDKIAQTEFGRKVLTTFFALQILFRGSKNWK